MSSVVLSPPDRPAVAASLPARRIVGWLLAAVVAIALIWLAMPRLAGEGSAPSGGNDDSFGFAGGRFPVRGIERAPALSSGNRLVRVRCGGAAAKTGSSCWISSAKPERPRHS